MSPFPVAAIEFLPLRAYDARLTAPTICTDRREYWRDDPIAHVVATFPAGPRTWDLRVEVLADVDHGPLQMLVASPPDPANRKVALLLGIEALPLGDYAVRLTLVDQESGEDADQASARFTKVDRAETPAAIPAGGIPIEVEAQAYLPDASWPVETGVPLPRGAIRDPAELMLFEDGAPVPAGLAVRGRWGPDGSIKWLGLAFTPRWNNGAPRTYRLRPTAGPAPAGTLDVHETAAAVAVDTGAITFSVSKTAFAGLEDFGPAASTGQPAGPRGGPFVVDAGGDRYDSWRSQPETFSVEHGATQVRITVAGWYASAGGQQLCRYHTQIRAFAGLAHVHVAHHTIITFDPAVTQLADAGWDIPAGGRYTYWTALDGRAQKGSLAVEASTGIHQDRADRCWLVDDGPGGLNRRLQGQQGDGWLSADDGDSGITVALRGMAEKFPKEIELARRGQESRLVLHFWPRHGQANTFTKKSTPPDLSSDALDRHNIHKLWYAHEGPLLNLTFPQAYAAELRLLAAGPAVEGENLITLDGDQPIDHALTGAAIGVAMGSDFAILSHPAGLSDVERAAFARMFQDDPGALPAPAWSAACGVEGRWAAPDARLYPQAERMLALGLPAFHHAVVDVPRQYGMWIYGGVHDNWLPVLNAPQLHRVWQNSHYRNAWLAWFLYLRSGLPAHRRWARVASDHYLDVGTIHHADPAVRGGKHVGDMYHCYAFTPWGGESDVWGHYVDPDAHRLRFLLTGDTFAREAYEAWWRALADLDGIPPGGGNREVVQTLGVLTDCYCHTFDPCALELVSRFADAVFAFFYDPAAGHYRFWGVSPNPPDHPVWHRQWLMLYHALTRDPRAVSCALDWIGEGYSDLSPNAFAAQATGDAGLVRRLVERFLNQCLQTQDYPGDRYHGYGPGVSTNYGTYLLQQAPYFLAALRDAGIDRLVSGERQAVYPTRRSGTLETFAGAWAVRLYVAVPGGRGGLPLRLQPLLGYGDVSPFGNLIASRWNAALTRWDVVVKEPFPVGQAMSLELPNNAPADWLCRIDLQCPDSRYIAPLTPFPEVAVLRKAYFNGVDWLYHGFGVTGQDWWLASLDAGPAELSIEGVRGYYDLPSFVALVDQPTGVRSGRTVFAYAEDNAGAALPDGRAVRVPLRPPGPWHIYTAATGGPVYKLLSGPDRLYLAHSPTNFAAVLPRLAGVDLT